MKKDEVKSFLEENLKNEQIGTDLLSLRNQADALYEEIKGGFKDITDASQKLQEKVFDIQNDNPALAGEMQSILDQLSNAVSEIDRLI